MKKYLTLLLFIAIQTLGAWSKTLNPADNLEQFVGRYKRMQGSTVLLLNMYVENGKLVSKQLWDFQVLPLEQKAGDDFTVIINQNNWPVKFIREGNKVTQMLVADKDTWTRVSDKPLNTEAMPAKPAEYSGKYKATINQKDMIVEVAVKNGKIWATQLWDGGKSAITYQSADNFFVNALDCPLTFKRGSDKKVNQLVLNNKEVFTKVD